MSEIMLINVSGQDKPGLTYTLMDILSAYDIGILDIGQAVIHNTVSVGVLVDVPDTEAQSPVLKDVLFHLHEQGMHVRFTPVSEEEYQRWVEGEADSGYVFTLLGRRITAEQIAQVTRVISDNDLNIEDIVRLSRREPLYKAEGFGRACIELTVRGKPLDLDAMKERFLDISQELDVDISFQADTVHRRNRRLVVFDMDSTLIQQEVIDELARKAGVGDEVSRVTEAAMRGELDFSQSLRQRVALLEGLDASVLEEVASELTMTEGAERLIRTLRSFGFKTAIVSGGFSYFGRRLQEKLGVDYVYANELAISDGHLTGDVEGRIVDGERKAELLQEIAQSEGLSLDQVVAVGDGANDLPMLRLAGLGVAFRAKPLVKRSARQSLSAVGLDGILYMIGIRDADAEASQHGST